ncbi:hypothetical protein [uncultured Paraglaciecola sp.]|uniref:hypothetical protein n=1 Tax=uncultured Paraglaciecola sp. TaxID=1765024 RepID=UPI0030D88F32|tara:strand:+ start:5812 stop:6213 length:402 start_codon:yes stop_codon:yes gene_type:complete
MKLINTLVAITLTFSVTGLHAQGSVHHSAQASKHSALALTEGVASTAKVASVAVAAPLVVAGGLSLVTGSVIAESADSVKKSHVSNPIKATPLVISDTTVTVDPAPNQVILIQNTTHIKNPHIKNKNTNKQDQ